MALIRVDGHVLLTNILQLSGFDFWRDAGRCGVGSQVLPKSKSISNATGVHKADYLPGTLVITGGQPLIAGNGVRLRLGLSRQR